MANKKTGNKNVLVGVCVAAVAIIAIILAVVLATNRGDINDSYFVSDGSKYVLTLPNDEYTINEITPVKVYHVYTYAGEKITSLKAYYEYADEDTAQKACDEIRANANKSFKSITINKKYVVIEADESEYENVTASDIKAQLEPIETDSEAEAATDEETVPEGEEVIIEEEPTEE